jgi:hypothetical protein
MANGPTTPSPGPGYTWLDGVPSGEDGKGWTEGTWAPIPGYVDPVKPAANTISGPNANINAAWQAPQWLQGAMAQQLTNPVSGYSPNANYGATLGRFQYSSTGPVPKTAPAGWGRYPGVDGSPPSAPWLAGQTAPRPVWGNFTPPPVTPTPPPNTIGNVPGGYNKPPVTITPPPNASGGGNGGNSEGFGPASPIGPNASGVPEFWNGPISSWGATAAKATGITSYEKVPVFNDQGKVTRYKWEMKVIPVPDKYKNLNIPWPSVNGVLPYGAFETLFPDSQGWTWSQNKPAGWGEGWLPNWTKK